MSTGGLIPSADNPLARLAARLPSILREAMEKALEAGLAASRRRMGSGGPRVRSGRLSRSLAYRVTQKGNTIVGELYSDVPYAGVHENGAVIQAKKARHLKFRVQGRWVQVKRVVIPARPYLRPGMKEAATRVEEFIMQGIERELS